MRSVINHFLRGLLFVFPIGATLYLVVILVQWANNTFNALLRQWFQIDIPGLGIVIAFALITLIGIMVSTAFIQPVFRFFERGISRMPLIKIIYSSIKDLTEAFVGDKKRFNVPVVMEFNQHGVQRMGFITKESMSELDMVNKVAVYCPHSYNFSGNLFIVPAENVQRIEASAASYMKFIISAGVTRIETNTKLDEDDQDHKIN